MTYISLIVNVVLVIWNMEEIIFLCFLLLEIVVENFGESRKKCLSPVDSQVKGYLCTTSISRFKSDPTPYRK